MMNERGGEVHEAASMTSSGNDSSLSRSDDSSGDGAPSPTPSYVRHITGSEHHVSHGVFLEQTSEEQVSTQGLAPPGPHHQQ